MVTTEPFAHEAPRTHSRATPFWCGGGNRHRLSKVVQTIRDLPTAGLPHAGQWNRRLYPIDTRQGSGRLRRGKRCIAQAAFHAVSRRDTPYDRIAIQRVRGGFCNPYKSVSRRICKSCRFFEAPPPRTPGSWERITITPRVPDLQARCGDAGDRSSSQSRDGWRGLRNPRTAIVARVSAFIERSGRCVRHGSGFPDAWPERR